ncbi:DEAD/DEAH box helicase [Desulforamulus profundi]|uniref:DEAD/DEAH box helicase n=1 Tax=Desulforamulus profundi TaxID=1383067 RepID=A0A2C6ME32_9FIRM|nr:DEAD/DEAH box helicase [Desulforamulus profundi]PHJ37613.1 DEAD/DEAH box helicase [Desulforamulus profundi]
MGLNPIDVTKHINDSYFRYLATTFNISDAELQEQLTEELRKPERFVKGPYLEITPAFQTGKCIRQLIKEGLLSTGFQKFGNTLDLDRPLYQHQEEASQKIVGKQRNLIVATGTGSGKTEAFLIPILHHLLVEHEQKKLAPGVRALLLYPMNALANDQMKRLRRLLRDTPFITFGRYTGETKETNQLAEKHFRQHFPKEERIPNELLSREEMREKPPHILLTNYAMLEFLLMRPADCTFFENHWGPTWRFIVLDEAHSYNGAKGIEMAMLLRRLKDRVVQGQKGVLRCIATSATLGRGREDFPAVVQFGEKLFGEAFEWVPGEPGRQDVIEATRLPVNELGRPWGKLDPQFYLDLWQALQENRLDFNTLLDVAKTYCLPTEVITSAVNKAGENRDLKRLLYEILKKDETLFKVREALKNPSSLITVAGSIFGGIKLVAEDLAEHVTGKKVQAYLVAFVDLAVLAKPGDGDQPLLPARYHLFVRALEGAFLSLWPAKKLYLDRKKSITDNGQEFPVFELGTCKRCGQEYIVGAITPENRLAQPQNSESYEKLDCFLIRRRGQEDPVADEDEEVLAASTDEDDTCSEIYELCSICGYIRLKNSSMKGCLCQQPAEERIWLLQRLVIPKGNKQQKCLSCGARAEDLIMRFITGQDAPTAVLATALYEKVPVKLDEVIPPVQFDKESGEDDEFSDDFIEAKVEKTKDEHGRKLLVFSDSRQDAAFFAPYLNRTYQQILWRRLTVKVLQGTGLPALRVNDLVPLLTKEAENSGLFSHYQSHSERQAEAYRWVMSELLAIDKGHSLEGLGLLKIQAVKPQNWKPVSYFTNTLKWDENKTWQLHQMLLNSFRHQGAITFPEDISPKDTHFAPRNRQHFFRKDGASPKDGVFAWLPSANKLNARIDYLSRIFIRTGMEAQEAQEECRRVLGKGFWEIFTKAGSPTWNYHFRVTNKKETGPVYQVDYRMWEISPSRAGDKWYRCTACGTVSSINLEGVCPKYRCQGTLVEVNLDQSLANNHYRHLYLNSVPIPMVVEEHTAQLTGEAAAELQEKFSNGEVNVLSCSTTFEMGVDVGELEVVFMRNVPPETANYVQRAGRAGRRTESTAFSLTYAQRRPHDLNYFAQPENMIAGLIHPPHFEMTNEKIVLRHVNAVALSRFFRLYREYFNNVDAFFRPEEPTGGLEEFSKFIETRPVEVLESLKNIVPTKIAPQIGLTEWAWVENLLSEDKGVLVRAAQEVKEDVIKLWEEKQRLDEAKLKSDYLLDIISTIKNRNLLSYLCSRNVLPKYGFPVDVVELKINSHTVEAARLSLDRDLRIAISEYAPGSQVVAGGRLWTSTALKRVPKLGWDEYYYSVCKKCGRYHSSRISGDLSKQCQACAEPLEPPVRFIVPIFGFMTSQEKPEIPGEKRPHRSYSSRVYFAEYYKDLEEKYKHRADEIREGQIGLKQCQLLWHYSPFGKLAVVNRGGKEGGFKLCFVCGYAVQAGKKSSKKPKPHKRPSGSQCDGTLQFCHLGHEFMSDTVELRFEGVSSKPHEFWLSLLYALLEGASSALSIARTDIDGCLYYYGNLGTNPAIVIFDNVPGGAGHAKRIGPEMRKVLWGALQRVNGQCGCGEETSCYGCLRNFHNQFCHDQLVRGAVKEFIIQILG